MATIVNELGFRNGDRKVSGMDELHEMAEKLFKQNRKMVKGRV
ncbi:hypothetical protein ACIQ2D_10020 [Lysinibacillus sp. NPDC097287]